MAAGNFRSSYYEKVGFRNVEEKKSLEILLKDKPLDRIKLKQFCLRFTVPGRYRMEIWKLLFKVTPIYTTNNNFIMEQRKQVYQDLLHALEVMKLLDDDTSKPQLFLIIWLLETGQMKFDLKMQLDDPMYKGFIAISQALLEMCEDDVDIYWMSKGYYTTVGNFYEHVPRLVDTTKNILDREDKKLLKHLDDLDVYQLIRLDRWFVCLFAGVLNESSLVKIWDKIIGGTYKILAFVAVVIFTSLRRNILNCNNSELVVEEVSNISEETCDVICNKAIELWQQYGSPLVIDDIKREKFDVQ